MAQHTITLMLNLLTGLPWYWQSVRQGVIAGAAVDTLSQEPPPPDHVLLAADIPNLIVTPHNAWASRTARQAALDQLAEVICAFAAGQPLNPVSPHDAGRRVSPVMTADGPDLDYA